MFKDHSLKTYPFFQFDLNQIQLTVDWHLSHEDMI